MVVPRSRFVVFALVALGGAVIDLLTKSWMFASLGMPGGESWWIIDRDIGFGFTTSLNEGALFGVGQGQVALFTLLSLVAAVAIVYWLFVRRAAIDWMLNLAMAGVMAGILGNMYDRVGLPALRWNYPHAMNRIGDPVFAVRDWIHVRYQSHSWPIFNIADSLLVCGVALLMWHSLRGDDSRERGNVADASDAKHAQNSPHASGADSASKATGDSASKATGGSPSSNDHGPAPASLGRRSSDESVAGRLERGRDRPSRV